MIVQWIDEIEDKYIAVLQYLEANFSVDAALRLAHEVDRCTEALKGGFQVGQQSSKVGLFKCTIKKHNILIYKVDKDKKITTIIDFISSRTNHSFND